ncbi:flagellar hook-length control protein FliK [Selenomonas ruminantium]|uniref:flagellar hook-length control protein FliK n=1 Tax=Selenomonas ruminantium TaxID=971 RepID=UPI0026F11D20|nr:flagellar hook-length control protein FliK [Selenomonas ruminantium]
MNAANVMAISPKAGAVNKVQNTRMVSKMDKASASASQGSFDEVLGKAGEEVTGKMAKSPTEAQGSIQGNVDAKEAYIKDDMPEGTEAALNSKLGKEPKSGKTAKDWEKNSQGTKSQNRENDTAGKQETETLDIAIAAVVNFTADETSALTVDEQIPQEKDAPAVVERSLHVEDTQILQRQSTLKADEQIPQAKVALTTAGQILQTKSTPKADGPNLQMKDALTVEKKIPQVEVTMSADEHISQVKEALSSDKQIPQAEVALTADESYPQVKNATDVNLQSLLPQSGAEIQKNKNFLAMLSGQQVKLSDGKPVENLPEMGIQRQEMTSAAQPAEGWGMGRMTKPATMLEIQLNNHQLANRAVLQENSVVLQQDLPLRNLQGSSQQFPLQKEGWSNVPLVNQAALQNEEGKGALLANQTVQENLQLAFSQGQRGIFLTDVQNNMSEEVERPQENLNNLQGTILNNGKERQDVKGMALFEQSEETMPSMPAGRVKESVIQQVPAQEMISEEPMPSMLVGRVKDSAIRQIPVQEMIPEEPMPSMPVGRVKDSAIQQIPVQEMILEEPMPSMPAESVKDSVIIQETGKVILPEEMVQTSPVGKKETVSVNNPLSGVSITVEDVVPMTEPAMEMQDNLQQNLYRQNQQAFPETKVVTTAEGEMVSQLVEEAVGDKSPFQSKSVPAGNPESAAMFQQSLNDSLTGSKMTNETNQTQNLQEDFNVPRQIVEQARLLRRGEDTQMVIKLHPDHLGELTLKVSVSANGAVNASFHSDNAQVRAIIENTLVQLKQELNNQGLKVDNVDVYAGFTDGQLPQGEGQQAWQQNQGHSSNGSMRNLGNVEDYGEETENIAAGVQSSAEAVDGVDYRV